MNSMQGIVGLLYVSLAIAAGGNDLLEDSNDILRTAIESGSIGADTRQAIMALVATTSKRSSWTTDATEPANHHALPAAMGTQATGKTPLKQNEGRALKEISYPHISCGEARNVEQKRFIVAPTNP
jgi:hypothetical protein